MKLGKEVYFNLELLRRLGAAINVFLSPDIAWDVSICPPDNNRDCIQEELREARTG